MIHIAQLLVDIADACLFVALHCNRAAKRIVDNLKGP